MLRLSAEGINGLRNAPTASGPTPSIEPDYEGFVEATRLIHKLRGQQRNASGTCCASNPIGSISTWSSWKTAISTRSIPRSA